MQVSVDMGLPTRIALPAFIVIAVLFVTVMAYFVKLGLTDSGTALGSGVSTEQGDARIRATAPPAPLTTAPAGTFTVPQTGTGPTARTTALPGNAVGGGPPTR